MKPITTFYQPRPHATCRLFCLHHVGGSIAYYAPWQKLLPEFIDVIFLQLPGRNATWQEAPITQWSDAIERTVHTITSLQDARPIMLFGHSLGALLSFEVAHKLQQQENNCSLLFASGMCAPQHYHVPVPRYTLPDHELLAYIASTDDATPNKDENYYAYLRALLPTIRADFQLVDSYQYNHSSLLTCPINIMGGQADPLYPPDTLLAWQEVTAGAHEFQFYNGGHMYLTPNRTAVIDYISKTLAAL